MNDEELPECTNTLTGTVPITLNSCTVREAGTPDTAAFDMARMSCSEASGSDDSVVSMSAESKDSQSD